MVEGAPEASRLNRLRQMWDEGRTALGVIATIPSVQVVQALAQTPLDFIVIDWNTVRSTLEPRMR
jgi:2-keto-3-deoxy-L-rhamnonate aldolase RhmA